MIQRKKTASFLELNLHPSVQPEIKHPQSPEPGNAWTHLLASKICTNLFSPNFITRTQTRQPPTFTRAGIVLLTGGKASTFARLSSPPISLENTQISWYSPQTPQQEAHDVKNPLQPRAAPWCSPGTFWRPSTPAARAEPWALQVLPHIQQHALSTSPCWGSLP